MSTEDVARVVHFSDWHGRFERLPAADLYVCTGDMLANTRACWWADKEPERRFQREWSEKNARRAIDLMQPSAAPLVLVRGNHDYIDLAPLFVHWPGQVIEIGDHSTFEMLGLRWGGFRGVPPICGEWADEIGEREIAARISTLGFVDVLVTHGPAWGCRDNIELKFGSRAIREHFDAGDIEQPSWHLFGHIHEGFGRSNFKGIDLSNAATGINELEFIQ